MFACKHANIPCLGGRHQMYIENKNAKKLNIAFICTRRNVNIVLFILNSKEFFFSQKFLYIIVAVTGVRRNLILLAMSNKPELQSKQNTRTKKQYWRLLFCRTASYYCVCAAAKSKVLHFYADDYNGISVTSRHRKGAGDFWDRVHKTLQLDTSFAGDSNGLYVVESWKG